MRPYALLSLVLLVLAPVASDAHSTATVTSPINGAVLTTPPAQFSVTLTEAGKLVQFTLQRAGESAARDLGPLPAQAAQHFQIKAPAALTPGKYTLRYRTISLDGHVAPGVIKFTIKPPGK